jgi:hypothetical protein
MPKHWAQAGIASSSVRSGKPRFALINGIVAFKARMVHNNNTGRCVLATHGFRPSVSGSACDYWLEGVDDVVFGLVVVGHFFKD